MLLHTFGQLLHVLHVQPVELLPAAEADAATVPMGLNKLALDERKFVERAIHPFTKEEHEHSLDSHPQDRQRSGDEV